MTAATPRQCDSIVRHGLVIDGTGAPRRAADVAIDGDRIVAIGELSSMVGSIEIEAAGRIVAPGFIDVHTHDDGAVISCPAIPAKTSQGVTTVVVGNCGFSLAPLRPHGALPQEFRYLGEESAYCFPAVSDYVAALETRPAAVNIAVLVGHSTLRMDNMADIDRPATDRELAAMQTRLRESLESGAIGFSTGLDYGPNAAATTEEIVSIAEVLSPFGGLYVTHTRDYVDDIDLAIEEALEIGRRANVPVVLSHHQGDGPKNYGHAARTLGRIERASAGQSVAFDVYPYTCGGGTLLPRYVEMVERVVVTWSDPHPEMVGRDIAGIAAEWRCTLREATARLIPGGGLYFSLDEGDVRRILSHPMAMIGSDGLHNERIVHPRLWGTFPRVLGRYARELGLFSLEEAIRRMTGWPAERFGLPGRGQLRPGAFADLVVFDPERVIDRATYEKPDVPAAGIDLVMVNGLAVWRDGHSTGGCSGHVVKRNSARRSGDLDI